MSGVENPCSKDSVQVECDSTAWDAGSSGCHPYSLTSPHPHGCTLTAGCTGETCVVVEVPHGLTGLASSKHAFATFHAGSYEVRRKHHIRRKLGFKSHKKAKEHNRIPSPSTIPLPWISQCSVLTSTGNSHHQHPSQTHIHTPSPHLSRTFKGSDYSENKILTKP